MTSKLGRLRDTLMRVLLCGALVAQHGCSQAHDDSAAEDARTGSQAEAGQVSLAQDASTITGSRDAQVPASQTTGSNDAETRYAQLAPDLIRLEVNVTGVHVVGTAGAVTPGSLEVDIVSVSSNRIFLDVAAPDGSFDIVVDASGDDTFSVRARNGTVSSNLVKLTRTGASKDEHADYNCQDQQREVFDYFAAAAVKSSLSCSWVNGCSSDIEYSDCSGSCLTVPFHYDAYYRAHNAALSEINETICPKRVGCPVPRCLHEAVLSECIGGQCRRPSKERPADVSECDWAAYRAERTMDRAIKALDLTCTKDSDCTVVAAKTGCNDACAIHALSLRSSAQLEQERQSVTASECAVFERLGCAKKPPVECPDYSRYEITCWEGRCDRRLPFL